jgi:hypothetical protein
MDAKAAATLMKKYPTTNDIHISWFEKDVWVGGRLRSITIHKDYTVSFKTNDKIIKNHPYDLVKADSYQS